MRRRRLGGALLCCGAALTACGDPGRSSGRELRIAAAASLGSAMAEASAAFAAERGGVEIVIDAGASGVLVQQALHGAPIDLLLAAAPEEIERLAERGLIEPATRRRFAGNRLVVIAPVAAPVPGRLTDLADDAFDRIATANPKTAPLGRYAQQALEHAGLWDALGPRLILAENARAVADYVARGEVACGIVYRTDARLAGARVVVAFEVAPASHAPIVYEGAVLVDAAEPELAEAFLDWLAGPGGRAILARHGFLAEGFP